jgi:hypothetical protein
MKSDAPENRERLIIILIHQRNIQKTITYKEAADKIGHGVARGLGKGATSAAREYFERTGDADLFRWLVSSDTGEPADGFYEWRRSIKLPLDGDPIQTCHLTGLKCLPGCDGKECAGLRIPLSEWPE